MEVEFYEDRLESRRWLVADDDFSLLAEWLNQYYLVDKQTLQGLQRLLQQAIASPQPHSFHQQGFYVVIEDDALVVSEVVSDQGLEQLDQELQLSLAQREVAVGLEDLLLVVDNALDFYFS